MSSPVDQAERERAEELNFRMRVSASLANLEEQIYRIVRLLRMNLSLLDSGRRRQERVTKAMEMCAAGKSWKKIYRVCFELHADRLQLTPPICGTWRQRQCGRSRATTKR